MIQISLRNYYRIRNVYILDIYRLIKHVKMILIIATLWLPKQKCVIKNNSITNRTLYLGDCNTHIMTTVKLWDTFSIVLNLKKVYWRCIFIIPNSKNFFGIILVQELFECVQCVTNTTLAQEALVWVTYSKLTLQKLSNCKYTCFLSFYFSDHYEINTYKHKKSQFYVLVFKINVCVTLHKNDKCTLV